MALGSYPDMELAEARKAARARRTLVDAGRDPLRASWREFDLDGATDSGPVWRLPASRTKTAAPISIPLVPAVVGWLKSLAEISGDSEFVFPKRRRDRRQRALHVGIDTLNAALAGVDHGLDAFTIRDLRRTMRTHLSALGIRSEVAERCLNHKLHGIQGVYNRHDYFAERRAALETWTALFLEIERGERYRQCPLWTRSTDCASGRSWPNCDLQRRPQLMPACAWRPAPRGQEIRIESHPVSLRGRRLHAECVGAM